MSKSKLYILPLLILLGIATTLFISCKDEKAKLIIPQGKMTDLLYDYHLAQAISKSASTDSATETKYIAALYEKYGITQEMFDSSMVYYLRHTDKMQEIYGDLLARINDESRLQGGENTIKLIAGTSQTGDTVNIWNKEQAYMISTEVPNNIQTFRLKADTAYHAGDRYILTFNTNFLYQDGTRNGLACLALKLKNDSVITRTVTLSAPNQVRVEVSDADREGVKELSGFIINRRPLADKLSSTVRLLVATDIQLLKIHTPEPIKQEDENEEKSDTDSVAVPVKPLLQLSE